jgi:lipid II:glycine glycyltransferase (peptidoglycan interpeptide bridge formation enzyme)
MRPGSTPLGRFAIEARFGGPSFFYGNSGILRLMKSFLQTQDWLDFQKSIGRKAWRFDLPAQAGDGSKIVANIIRHDLPFGKSYLYVPHGPEIHLDQISGGLKNELESFFAHIRQKAKEQNAIFVKFEPLQDSIVELIYGAGLKKSSKEIQAPKSVVVDVDKSDEELLAAMHHKTRYNIKVAEKHDIKVGPSTDIDTFIKLLKKTADRQKFHTHPDNYYRKLYEFFKDNNTLRSGLVFATHNDKPIAGGLYLVYDETCYYLHGGSDHEYRQYMAPYALHWEGIKWARQHGLKYYDFGGSEGKKWPNLTRFKLNWGGRQVEYPGAFDLSTQPFWFLMYKILRKIL